MTAAKLLTRAAETSRSKAARTTIPVDKAALFLDLDGAIVPIAPTPDAVRASPACRIVLKRALDHLRGRMAILSGRTIAAVDEVLGSLVHCVAGVHGLQRRTPDAIHLEEAHPQVAEASAVLETLARARPGLLVERKDVAVALHYRQAPNAEDAVIDAVERLAAATGLEVQLGKAVAELRPPGPDKGEALTRFMREPPFSGSLPIYVGDDLTDEAGFAAAHELGGMGILVGDGLVSRAEGRLSSPPAVLAWIMRSLDSGRFDLPEARWAD